MRPLRVFQVITRMVRGGAQRVVVELLRRLPREEFEPFLVCGEEGRTLLPEAEGAAAGVFRIRSLVREIRPAADVRAASALFRLFLRERPDVVHAHTYKAGAAAVPAARAAGVPVVVFSPHGHIFARGGRIPGVPEGGWRRELLRWVTRAVQACAHRVTVLSEIDLREHLALGLSGISKYRVIRNGIDPDRFRAEGRRPLGGAPVIGAVGRFTAEKGHLDLVEAFARIRRVLPGARLVLVGSGPMEGELRRRAEELGLGRTAVLLGERDSAEVLGSFDLFVQPSLYESQGLAILEAMAAGCPVVATDVGGVRDAVRDGETGILVPPADPAALAEAVLRLIREPGRAAALAERARREVRERFSVERMVGEYGRLYRELAGLYNPARCTTS